MLVSLTGGGEGGEGAGAPGCESRPPFQAMQLGRAEAGSDVFTLYIPLIPLRTGAPCLAGPPVQLLVRHIGSAATELIPQL